MNKLLGSQLLNFLVIFLVSLFLVIIWFKDGYIMGTAEAVLPFYKLERYLNLTYYAWTFHPGLGNISGITVASKPTYLFLSYLQNLGVPGYILQAFTFLFILLSAGFGSYFLTRELFHKLPTRYYLFSCLFYLFNPISLANVWNRFLPNFIFFYGLLPFGVLIFTKGLKQKKYYYAILLSTILLFYSFAFSSIAFLFLIWIVFGIFGLFYILTSKTWGERFFIVRYFLISLAFFMLVNSWYLTQLANYTVQTEFESSIRSFHPQETNIATLDSLSKKMGNLTDLYRLSNSYFFNELELSWIKIYNTFPILLASFVTTSIVLYGLLKGRREKQTLLLGFVLFIGIFLSKGSNPPLGFIYKGIFEQLVFLQVFRNPIEKFSFILILVFSPLFALGLYYLSAVLKKTIVSGLALLIIGIWAYPFYTSLVFTAQNHPNNNPAIGFKVEVPGYYEQTNQFLERQGGNFRVIGFPIADEGITYLWRKGYQGADLPSTLFSMPVIFFNTPVPYYYEIVKQLEPTLDEEGFINIARFLNARFFFVREDIDFKSRNLSNPEKIEEKLLEKERKGQLKKVAEYGKLKIWENTSWKDTSFYTANKLIATSQASLVNLKSLSENETLVEGNNLLSIKENSLPKINYQKINPAFYKVTVENANSPFILVFSDTYNYNWEAFIKNQKIDEHFRVNTYANGWNVNNLGDFEIEIKFRPQSWLEVSEIISIISFLVGSTYLLFLGTKNLKH